MRYEFVPDSGLYYGEELVAEFCPEVVGIREYCFLDTGIRKKIFSIKVRRIDGSETDCKEVEKLSGVSYFDLWNIPDCDLTRNQKKRLMHKMQLDVSKTEVEQIIVGNQGLYSYRECQLYFWGEQIITYGCHTKHMEIKTNSGISLMNMGVAGNKAILIEKYLNFFPGVSEILFYGSLLAVVKPILCQLGYKPDFVISLVGPSGHLKTSLVRKYALWLEDRETQEVSFRDFKRVPEIISMLNRIPGQNFLADDLHEAISGNAAMRQSERLDTLVRHIGQHANCANVIITGETMKKMGIFSCMDRILQIKVPQMSSDQLKTMKNAMNQLADTGMMCLASEFLNKLMKNFDEVQKLVEEFWNANYINSDANYDTRTFHHGLFIKLTEELFCRYVCFGLTDTSGREKLHMALENNYRIQQSELQWKRQEECNCDYVLDVFNMLQAKDRYVKVLTARSVYCPDNSNCLMDNNRIFITGKTLVKGMTEYYQHVVPLKKITDALHQAGVLEEDTDARTKKYDGIRHYVISLEMMRLYKKWKQD